MSYFSSRDARVFVLDKFKTVGKSTDKWWVKLCGVVPKSKQLFSAIFPMVSEKGSWFHPEIKGLISRDVYLSGYWMSPKYFDDIKDILYSDFLCNVPLTENSNLWKKRILEDELPTVSVHIRRGDYLQSETNRQIYKVMPSKYYLHCLQDLTDKVGNFSIYVFSNDIDWVRKNMDFGNKNVQYVTGNDEDHGYEDMILMWECKHHIIANSTFSWWGAYLSNGNGEVYAPDEWYCIDGDLYDIHDLYPDEWIKVKVN